MSAPLCRAARVVAQRAPTSTATSVRCFSAEAALAPAKEGVSAISATPAPVAAPLPPVAKRGANLVDRVWAFLVGVGVGGIGFYYKLSEDVIESTAEVKIASLPFAVPRACGCWGIAACARAHIVLFYVSLCSPQASVGAFPRVDLTMCVRAAAPPQIDTRIIGLRAEVSNSNEALRRRVATLENQLQEIQERLEKA